METLLASHTEELRQLREDRAGLQSRFDDLKRESTALQTSLEKLAMDGPGLATQRSELEQRLPALKVTLWSLCHHSFSLSPLILSLSHPFSLSLSLTPFQAALGKKDAGDESRMAELQRQVTAQQQSLEKATKAAANVQKKIDEVRTNIS
jgi:chromosome segregation ATPase